MKSIKLTAAMALAAGLTISGAALAQNPGTDGGDLMMGAPGKGFSPAGARGGYMMYGGAGPMGGGYWDPDVTGTIPYDRAYRRPAAGGTAGVE